jgi:2'-5' RNA ligase
MQCEPGEGLGQREAGERGRLFVALELEEDVRGALAAWGTEAVSSLPGIRPVAEAALHVTLCFLGTQPMGELDAIAAACAVGSGERIAGLRLGAAMWLPRRRPRVLAVELEDGTGALGRVQSALAQALAAGGWYRPETRPYLPHVTVARVAKDARLGPGARLASPPVLTLADTDTVTLYRSHLSRAGARYEVVRVVGVE